jgi:hypothetical protein
VTPNPPQRALPEPQIWQTSVYVKGEKTDNQILRKVYCTPWINNEQGRNYAKQDGQCAYKGTIRRVRAAIVVVEKQ